MNNHSGIVEELYQPVRKIFKRRKLITKGLYEYIQADLIDMQKFSSSNND